MTKMTDAIGLASMAKEEASRAGHPAIDVEHLFLALVLSGGLAGAILRARGADIASARDAVQAVHDHRLAALGIAAPSVAPGPIRPAATGPIDWTPRALDLLRQPQSDRTDLGLLRAMLAERSGLIDDVLVQLGIEPADLRGDLDAHLTHGDSSSEVPRRPAAHRHRVSGSGFVPAPIEAVWELLSDPMRRTEWDDLVAAVHPDGPGKWVITPRRLRLDGRPAKRAPKPRRALLRQVNPEKSAYRLEWHLSYPDARPSGLAQRVVVRLGTTAGGTSVAMDAELLAAGSPLRRLARRLLGPFQRFVIRSTLTAQLVGISRYFR